MNITRILCDCTSAISVFLLQKNSMIKMWY